MDDRGIETSNDVKPRRSTHSKPHLNDEEEENMTVKDLIKRMSHFRLKISLKLTRADNYIG